MLSANKQQLALYGVNRIGLFGSYVRNEMTPNSDIDLLVDIQKDKKTFNNFLSLNHFLEDLFGKKVELVTTQSLSPYIFPLYRALCLSTHFSSVKNHNRGKRDTFAGW